MIIINENMSELFFASGNMNNKIKSQRYWSTRIVLATKRGEDGIEGEWKRNPLSLPLPRPGATGGHGGATLFIGL